MKTVTFYTNKEDQELYEFANTINFQKFVKLELKMFKRTIEGMKKAGYRNTTIQKVMEMEIYKGDGNGNIQN